MEITEEPARPGWTANARVQGATLVNSKAYSGTANN